MKAYPIVINDVQVLVEHDGFNVKPITDNLSRELVTSCDFRYFMDTFPHTGRPTGSEHIFTRYSDGTILGTHGGNLLTKLPRLAEVNEMLRRRGLTAFS